MLSATKIYYFSKILYRFTCSKNKVAGRNAILMYHGVSDNFNRLCVSKDFFKKQMRIIGERYQIVSLTDLILNIKKNTRKNLLAITFDDALKNLSMYAFPVLQDLNYPATIFVPTKFVGGKNDWQTLGPNYSYEIMSFKEMRNNSNELITYGSHSVSHSKLSFLNDYELYQELVESKTILEKNLDQKIKYFSYPHGTRYDYDGRTIALLKKVGYEAACTTRWGRFNSYNDLYELKRVLIRGTDCIEEFTMKINGYYDWLGIKERLGFFLNSILYGTKKFVGWNL